MSIARGLKRKGKAAIPPLVFLSLVTYFLWQATQGDRGLQAYALRQDDLKAAQAELQRAEIELAAWERRVTALRTSRLDPDSLDERSRAMLNLSDPNDIIVPYGSGQRLF
ncbi:FtsB family cell division protein [Limobrevibacterium gyesilva]|uniref:Septum formation initiator family protein n=1 Tax=Limobrevibacterium gyesilva TaxID=2991712 RepID=A0AA42CI20_9PROT|nr:septum formation initiator family protein [Limobrevibacterium gyesilva]MCW3475445.1 septum formation initiator family protein [Limobrevibacterium gyesilva]